MRDLGSIQGQGITHESLGLHNVVNIVSGASRKTTELHWILDYKYIYIL